MGDFESLDALEPKGCSLSIVADGLPVIRALSLVPDMELALISDNFGRSFFHISYKKYNILNDFDNCYNDSGLVDN